MKTIDTGIVNGWKTFQIKEEGSIYTRCGVYVMGIGGTGFEQRITHNSEVSPTEVAMEAESIYAAEKPKNNDKMTDR